jgi:hypothetical protein
MLTSRKIYRADKFLEELLRCECPLVLWKLVLEPVRDSPLLLRELLCVDVDEKDAEIEAEVRGYFRVTLGRRNSRYLINESTESRYLT